MKFLPAALQRLFVRPAPQLPLTNAICLPPSIIDALTQKKYGQVQQWLQKSMPGHLSTPDLRPLIDAARHAGWSDFEIGKLETFAHYHRGNAAMAFQCAERLLGTAEFDPDLAIIAMLALNQLGRFEAAWQRLAELDEDEQRLAERADFALAAALTSAAVNQPQSTHRYISAAWALAPNDTMVACYAYSMYFELGDLEAFEKVRVTFLNNFYQRSEADLAFVELAQGFVELAKDNYETGFDLLERRYKTQYTHRYLNRSLLERPRWQGDALHDRTLLVSVEQGLGDTIQMVRFLPVIESRGVARLVLEAQPEALTLLQFNFPRFEILTRKFTQPPPQMFDVWTGLMSLPHLLATTAATIPDQAGYLKVPPEHNAYWSNRVSELARPARACIGLAWSGHPEHRADRRRSVPFASMMERIRLIDADFFALQTRVHSEHPLNLIDVSEELITLADTAALIVEMDLIITVDTSVVHLAGALGHPTWLLLPYRYEWRWGLEGETNRWYQSVRVLRSKRPGDWHEVLTELFEQRLPAWLKSHSRTRS